MRGQNENRNTSNQPYTVTNLRVSPHTGSHAYTRLSCERQPDILTASKVKELCLKYPHIEHADIPYNGLETLRDLQKFHHLRWLNAAHNELTTFDLDVDWNIESNSGNQSLLQLIVSCNALTKLDSLSQHQHLEILDLSFNELTDLSALASLHLLQSLNIDHNQIDDLSPLKQLPIAEFIGSHNRITSLDALCAEHIRLCNVANNAITHLDCTRSWQQLTEFNIAGNKVQSFQALHNLTRLSLLRTLNVERNPIEFTQNPVDIEVLMTQHEDEVLENEILWILPDLEWLNGSRVDSRAKVESMFNHDAFRPDLDSIAAHFESPAVDVVDSNADHFWYRLVEEEFAVCWEGFISKFPYLSTTNIDLHDVQIGNAGLHAVCDCIQQCQDLTELNLDGALSQHRWSDTNKPWPWQYLCDSLLVHNTIRVMDLSRCAVDSVNFEPIASMIEHCHCLHTLALSHNRIGQHTLDAESSRIITPCPAIKMLSESVLKTQSLKVLSLDHNQIDALGAYELGRCLQDEKCPLEELNASHNPFGRGGNGFGEMAKAIKANPIIKALDISFCLTDSDTSALVEAAFHSLKDNRTLIRLDLSGNVLSENAMEYLALALSENQSVSALIMKQVALNEAAMQWIINTLSTKSNLVEFAIDTQGRPQNVVKLLTALSDHSRLESLSVSHARSDRVVAERDEPADQFDSDAVKQTLQRLSTFELSASGLSSVEICRVLENLLESNSDLRNLDLTASTLNDQCWNVLNSICNKCPLQRLVLSRCAVEKGAESEFDAFWQTMSVRKSLVHLDLSRMEWNGIDAVSRLLESVDRKMANDQRDFCLDLSGVALSGRAVLETHDYVHLLFSALSGVGVTELKLDEFTVEIDGGNVSISPLDVTNEIFYHLARSRYSVSALSLSGCDLDVNENKEDRDSFVKSIRETSLKRVSLPKMGDENVLKQLQGSLRHSCLNMVQIEEVLGMDFLNARTAGTSPLVISEGINGAASKEIDFKINDYVCSVARDRCCS